MSARLTHPGSVLAGLLDSPGELHGCHGWGAVAQGGKVLDTLICQVGPSPFTQPALSHGPWVPIPVLPLTTCVPSGKVT